MRKYDLIVLGSGPGGEKAAVKAAYFGYKVALIEKQPTFGGSEVSSVIPSQLMRELANYCKVGISIENYNERKKSITEQRQKDVEDNLIQHQVDIYKGIGSFENANTIKILGEKQETICGEFILIATGSCPMRPDDIAFDGKFIHDTEAFLNLDHFPKNLCVVGASAIGFEFATLFSIIGCKVRFINENNDVLPFLDHEIVSELLEVMKEENIDMVFDKKVKEAHVENDRVKVTYDSGESEEFEMMVYACMRKANTSHLDCQKIGMYFGQKDVIEVDERYASNIPHIYAVGDVIGFPARASTSMEQGRIAVSHMFHTRDLETMAREIPYTLYTIPEIASVGLTEEKAKELKVEYVVGKARYDHMAKGRIRMEKYGILKLIFYKVNLKIIGVHIIGTDAAELIHYGTALVEEESTISHLIGRIFNDPSYHDLYKYAAYDGLSRVTGHKLKFDE